MITGRINGKLAAATVVLVLFSALHGAAEEADDPGSPWTRVIYDAEGRLVAASGIEGLGTRLDLRSSTETFGDRVMTRTSYRRGGSLLTVEKTYESATAMDIVYEAGDERLVVSLTLDDLTGEILAVYRLPDGTVFSLWFAEDGGLLSGDLDGLRRELRSPMEISRMLRSFVQHRKTIGHAVPSPAEGLLMLRVSCTDLCASGCELQCAFECNLGLPICQLCRTACALGCLIGCN